MTTVQLKNHFYTKVAPIVSRDLYSGGHGGPVLQESQQGAQALGGVRLSGGASVLGVMTFVLRAANISGWGFFFAAAIISAIIVWAFASRMPQRTAKGAQEQKKWEAFRNYLQDLTRFTDMEAAKEKFEKYLPYAIAFGVEKHWTQRFEELTVPAPDWYHPPVIVWGSPGTGPIGGGLGGGLPSGVGWRGRFQP